jgi:hypothetical protein
VGLAGLLLAKGADVNAQDPLDHIPLSEPNTAEMFELLQAHKAVGMQGRTPLHVAADYGLKEAVERLLSGQADVKATDKNGDTPLHLAVAGLVKSSGWLPGQGMVPPVGPQGGSGVPPGGWRPPFPGVPGSVGPTGSGQRPSTPGSAHTQPRGPTVSQPPGSAPQFPCDATKKAAYWSIVTLLLEHKADPNEKNLRGQAPWNVAVVGMIGGRSGEVSDLLRLLERHGADLPAVWRSGAKEK